MKNTCQVMLASTILVVALSFAVSSLAEEEPKEIEEKTEEKSENGSLKDYWCRFANTGFVFVTGAGDEQAVINCEQQSDS